MAEYKALAQNTYKFITERTLKYAGDIGTPNAPQSSKVKAFIDGKLVYLPLSPIYSTTSSSSTYLGRISSTFTNAGLNGSTTQRKYGDLYYVPASVKVDGVAYYGTRNAIYACYCRVTQTSVSTSSTYELPETIDFPSGTIKVVKYSATEGTIVAAETKFSGGTLTPVTVKAASSSSNSTGCQEARFYIEKNSNDIILAISIEYPKYDITLSGTGLQYSLDDGVTFADVTSGLVLEQIEHIVFKNTDTVTHNIGTTADGVDVANIASGTTYVAVPNASGTWYIS